MIPRTTKMTTLALAFALAVGFAAPALAQGDPAIEQARAAAQIGEQADGFLGVVDGANLGADLRARVDQINIRRRAAYADIAERRGVSVREVAAATGCSQLQNRVEVGHAYRDEAGAWARRTATQPVRMPAYCPAPAAG